MTLTFDLLSWNCWVLLYQKGSELKMVLSFHPSTTTISLLQSINISPASCPIFPVMRLSTFVLWRLDYCNSAIYYRTIFSDFSTLLHDLSSALDRSTMYHRRWSSYIGCPSNTVFDTNCTCMLMHSVHIKKVPQYLTDSVVSVAQSSMKRGLWSVDTVVYVKPRTRTKLASEAFVLPVLSPGTVYHRIFTV